MRKINNEKSEYYQIEMKNGGFCIKYYKPSELEDILKTRSVYLGRLPKYKKIGQMI